MILLVVSLVSALLSLFGPVIQSPPISWEGASLQVLLLAVFWATHRLGSRAASRIRVGPSVPASAGGWIAAFFAIGIVGAALQVAGKLEALGGLSFNGIYALRAQRAEELASAGRSQAGWSAAFGFIAYPAGIVGACAFIRWYERMRATQFMLAAAFGTALVMMTVFAGGRGPILAAGAVVFGTAILRMIDGQTAIPRSRALRLGILFAVVCFIGYSSVIWSVRSESVAMDAQQFLDYAEDSWGMAVRPGFREVVEPRLGVEGLRIVVASSFYLSQSTSVLERIISAPSIPPMFGLYQIDVVAAAYRVFASADGRLLADGNQALLAENVYGFFAGAWGGLLIDFGYAGAIVATAAWGWLAGRSWGAAISVPGAPFALMLAFWLAASLWSFASSPLGFSNAATLLCWFVVFSYLVRPCRRGGADRFGPPSGG